jgi:hypothetical protein
MCFARARDDQIAASTSNAPDTPSRVQPGERPTRIELISEWTLAATQFSEPQALKHAAFRTHLLRGCNPSRQPPELA